MLKKSGINHAILASFKNWLKFDGPRMPLHENLSALRTAIVR